MTTPLDIAVLNTPLGCCDFIRVILATESTGIVCFRGKDRRGPVRIVTLGKSSAVPSLQAACTTVFDDDKYPIWGIEFEDTAAARLRFCKELFVAMIRPVVLHGHTVLRCSTGDVVEELTRASAEVPGDYPYWVQRIQDLRVCEDYNAMISRVRDVAVATARIIEMNDVAP